MDDDKTEGKESIISTVFSGSRQLVEALEHGSIPLRFFRVMVDVNSMRSKNGWWKVICPCSYENDNPDRTGGFLYTDTGGWRYKCFRHHCTFYQTVYWEPKGFGHTEATEDASSQNFVERLNDRAIELWLCFGGSEDALPEIERYVRYQQDALETYQLIHRIRKTIS